MGGPSSRGVRTLAVLTGAALFAELGAALLPGTAVVGWFVLIAGVPIVGAALVGALVDLSWGLAVFAFAVGPVGVALHFWVEQRTQNDPTAFLVLPYAIPLALVCLLVGVLAHLGSLAWRPGAPGEGTSRS